MSGCLICGALLTGRANRQTCSPRCRQALHRHPERALTVIPGGASTAASKPAQDAPRLSERELLGIVEAAASAGSWQAARFLLDRIERRGPPKGDAVIPAEFLRLIDGQ